MQISSVFACDKYLSIAYIFSEGDYLKKYIVNSIYDKDGELLDDVIIKYIKNYMENYEL